MSRVLSDAEYTQAVSLCRSVVEAAGSDDGGPMVAGSFLGRLRDFLAPVAQIERSALNAEVARVLGEMAETARNMGEERAAIFIDGHARIYRSAVPR